MSKRYRRSSNTPAWVWIVAVILALACLSSLASNLAMDAPAGGGGGGISDTDHVHVYDRYEEIPAAHKSLATCTTPAVYYLSCSCGFDCM